MGRLGTYPTQRAFYHMPCTLHAAAGAIMYPIAAVAGDTLGVDPRKMSVAIMLGASAGFINPFSYQCNLMVS